MGGERGGNMTSRPHYESPDDDVGLNVLRCQADILAGRGGGWGSGGRERGQYDQQASLREPR